MDKKFIQRLTAQTVYLWEDEQQLFIKSLPGDGGFLAKYPGGEEFKITDDSDQVTRALEAQIEVSEKNYLANKVPKVRSVPLGI